ncbi:MAG: Na+/H+ antiporter subunit E [Microcella sp.]
MTSPWSLPLRLVAFVAWFVWQVVVTSVQVSALILTPGRQPEPGIVRVELDELSESELTLLVALITITPDTLVIALDRDARIMYVHGMFVAGDADGFRASVLNTERRLLRGIRLRPPAITERRAS